MQTTRLKIAIQKKGRLNVDSEDLLRQCGLRFHPRSLLCHVENLEIDILFVRDDDIPTLVNDGVCQLGIVGANVLEEKESQNALSQVSVVKPLGFGSCQLSIAVPNEMQYKNIESLSGLRIATSYPGLLRRFLEEKKINATIQDLSGSVEIAPLLSMSDAICDLVSTGLTLEENRLKPVETIFKSEALLIKNTQPLDDQQARNVDLLLRRMDGVVQARECKYILFHAPKASLEAISELLPGAEHPTVMSLTEETVVVHVVSREKIFWDTLEAIKKAGASSILVLPIEKMMR